MSNAVGRKTPLPGYDEPPKIHNYQFRRCSLHNSHIGALRQGEEIGTANQLQLTALRRHPSGKWA